MNVKQAREHMARHWGVSARAIEQAAYVAEHGIPELLDMVRKGATSLGAAEFLAHQPHDVQRRIVGAVPPKLWRAHVRGESERVRARAHVRHCPTCACGER